MNTQHAGTAPAMRRLVFLLCMFSVLLGPGIPRAGAATYLYDAPSVARAAVHDPAPNGVSAGQFSGQGERVASTFVVARGTSTTSSVSVVATEAAGGARFVAGSDGVVTDLVGNAPNAVSLGHFPEYVDLGAQTGARTFSMSDEAWNAMSADEQWIRNQSFLDRAIANGSEFRLATPLDAGRPGSFFERELQYLFKQGFVPNGDGTMLIPGAP
jgi:hypothetical protein